MKKILIIASVITFITSSNLYAQCSSCWLASKKRIFIGTSIGLTDQNSTKIEHPTYIFDVRIGYFVGKKVALQTGFSSFSRTIIHSESSLEETIPPYQSINILLRYHFYANRCGDFFLHTGYSIGSFNQKGDNKMLHRFTLGGLGYMMKLHKNLNLEVLTDVNKDNMYPSFNMQARLGLSYFLR